MNVRCDLDVFSRPSGRYALALLSGILNGVAFIWIGSFSLFANVPLLYALHRASTSVERMALGALVGFLAGVHIYGIAHYGWFLLIIFAFYTASQMLLYGLLFHCVWQHLGSWGKLCLPVTLWTLTEWIRTLGSLSMPSSYAGNIALDAWLAPWLYLAPHLGGLFVSACVALFQSCLFLAILNRVDYRTQVISGLTLLCVLGVLGFLNPPDLGSTSRSVVAVQSGLHNSRYNAAKVDPMVQSEVINTFEALSKKAYKTRPDFVIWPETALRIEILSDEQLMTRLFPPSTHPSTLIAGLPVRHGDEVFNAALSISGGEIDDQVHKVKLVLGTEDHFTAGFKHRPLNTRFGRVGIMICLEAVYPQIGQMLVKDGAEFLTVISNDAGFGDSPITHHMTRRAVMRALETGRWLVRVGQAGLSVVVTPRGEIVNSLDLFVPRLMSHNIRLRSDHTFFVRQPNLVAHVNLALLFTLLLFAVRRRIHSPSP
jgi:apolipoprotein N-acyltransferase